MKVTVNQNETPKRYLQIDFKKRKIGKLYVNKYFKRLLLRRELLNFIRYVDHGDKIAMAYTWDELVDDYLSSEDKPQ